MTPVRSDRLDDLDRPEDPLAPVVTRASRRSASDAEPPRRRRLRRALIALLCAGTALLVAFVSYGYYVESTANDNLRREAMLPDDSTGGGAGWRDPRSGKKAGTLVTGEGENILFLGSDARPGETVSRSDVIVLAHVNKARTRVDLIHFPRDLFVPIPGRAGRDKINHSFAYGGAPLLVRTLENLVGVKVDHVVKTDFEGFKNITDAVGGVRVYAEEASNGRGNGGPVAIRQGWNDLNGEQALAFVRERYQLSQGDISRGRRQQAFLKALMLKVLDRDTLLNPVKFSRLVDVGTKNTTVDESFDRSTLRSQALSMRKVRGEDIHFVTAPYSGLGTARGMSIVVMDDAGMHDLAVALRKDSMSTYEARSR